jgi:hypothetical protein
MSFKISKIAAEHLGPAGGTQVFRRKVVGNHCSKAVVPNLFAKRANIKDKKV